MKIQLLYMDDCPNWQETLQDIQSVIKQNALDAKVEMVKVNTPQEAEALAFPGSPTVRVEDMDVEPDAPASGFGLECRVYWVDDRPQGKPPIEWIAAAIEVAME